MLGCPVRPFRLSHVDDPQAAFLAITIGPVDRRTGLHSNETGAHEGQHGETVLVQVRIARPYQLNLAPVTHRSSTNSTSDCMVTTS